MKSLIKYLSVAGLSAVLGFIYTYHIPKIKDWIRLTIYEQSKKHAPLVILPKDVRLHVWPIGFSLHDLRIRSKPEVKNLVREIDLESLYLNIDPLTFLTGRFQFSDIVLNKGLLVVKTDALKMNKSSKLTEKQISELLTTVLDFPVSRITIKNMDLKINIEKQKRIEIDDFSFEVSKAPLGLLISAQSSALSLKSKELFNVLPLEFSITSLVQRKDILLSSLILKRGGSYLLASGKSKWNISDFNFNDYELNIRTHFLLRPVKKVINRYFPKIILPEVSGLLDSDIQITESQKTPKFNFKTKTRGLSIDSYKIGNLETSGELKSSKLNLKNTKIYSSYGLINLPNFKMNDLDSAEFDLGLKNVELRELLIAIGVGATPLHLNTNATLPCKGTLISKFQIYCKGELKATDFVVFNSETKEDFIEVDTITFDGDIHIGAKDINTQAKVKIGNNTWGNATGKFIYTKGFDINFQGDNFDFADIKNLANLKIEGSGKIKGRTWGDSNFARVETDTDFEKFWFEDYFVDQFNGDLLYRDGKIIFKNIRGKSGASKYRGYLTVNLVDESLIGKVNFPAFQAENIQSIFGRITQLPFKLKGVGNAELYVRGPFQFNKLSYTLNTSIQRGNIGIEPFDQIIFNVESKSGNVEIKKAEIKRGQSIIDMTGKAWPNGNINVDIKGEKFQLSDLKFLKDSGLNISGPLEFSLTLKDHILSPSTSLDISLPQLKVGTKEFEGSQFSLTVDKSSVRGDGKIFNNMILTNFIIPVQKEGPFKLKLTSEDWDFTPLFSLFNPDISPGEYNSNLKLDIDLKSPSGGFWNSSGKVKVSNFKLRHGTLGMSSEKSFEAIFQNGNITVDGFKVTGDNTFIQINSSESNEKELNFSINGKIEMALISFLTPFFSELRGELSLVGTLTGSAESPKLVGSAFVDRGFARLLEIPHPFEDFKLDVLFNKDRIIVNSLQSRFASGRLLADGQIRMLGIRKMQTILSGRLEGATLNIPEGFTTSGSGQFTVRGNWFPYTLAGTYNVAEGLIVRNITDLESEGDGIQRSLYLPTFLTQDDLDPLFLDLKVNFPRDLIIRNNLLDAVINGAVQIKGSPTNPILLGELNIEKGGRLFFRKTPFIIDSAFARFDNERENNPSLYASAKASIAGLIFEESVEENIGRKSDFDISLLLQGTRKSHELTLTSTPPLSQQDIISLLALGMTSGDLERLQQNSIQGYEIGSTIFSQTPVSKGIRKTLGVDVSLDSSIDETQNAAIPKVVLKKKITPKIEASVSRSLGEDVIQDFDVNYQLNNNISIIGSWETRTFDNTETIESNLENTNVLGVDLEYRVDFK